MTCSADHCNQTAFLHLAAVCRGGCAVPELGLCLLHAAITVELIHNRCLCPLVLVGAHRIATPGCTHPDRQWRDDGCVVPTVTVPADTRQEANA